MAPCCCGNNPPTLTLKEEVNGDGVLNVYDLILVVENCGTIDYGIVDADWIGSSNIEMSTCPNNLV